MARALRIAESIKQDALTLLRETRDFIAKHPGKWTTDAFAYDKEGNTCSAASPEAKQFCALGFAIDRAADLFGVESHRATRNDALMDDVQEGTLIWTLNKEANRIYTGAVRALDAAVVDLTEQHDDVVDYNDYGGAKSARDIVKVYDRAIELVQA